MAKSKIVEMKVIEKVEPPKSDDLFLAELKANIDNCNDNVIKNSLNGILKKYGK